MKQTFYKAGPATPGLAGVVPISWSELRAWSEMTQTSIQPWMAEALMLMSRAYCAAHSEASDGPSAAPWTPNPEKRKATAAETLASGLRAMAKSGRKGK